MSNPTSKGSSRCPVERYMEKVKTAHAASTGQESALWRKAGRTTKANPEGEDETWWFQEGRAMLTHGYSSGLVSN